MKLKTPQVPVNVKIKSFNPLIPGDIGNSSIPIAILDFELTNTSDKEISFSICGTMQNFIGEDGSQGKAVGNKNIFREERGIRGIFFTSDGVDKKADQWGDMTLVSTSKGDISYRTAWLPERWGSSILDFWDDLSKDGKLDNMDEGLKCIKNIRDRYDGMKRNPFDEAECGHHYGRAMASWSAFLALTGFHYSGVTKSITFTSKPGTYFWSNGYSWGTCKVIGRKATLNVLNGQIKISEFNLSGTGSLKMKDIIIKSDESKIFEIK